MPEWKQRRFLLRLAATYGLLAMPLALAAAALLIAARHQQTREHAEQNRNVVTLAQRALETLGSIAGGDVQVLAADAGTAEALAARTPSDLDRVATAFERMAQVRGIYARMRLIGSDGREVVRVDDIDGQARRVPEQELRDDRGRPFVRLLRAQPGGAAYMSQLGIGITATAAAARPIIRVGMPVFGTDGTRLGMLVFSVRAEALVRRMRDDAARIDGELWLADAAGHALLGPHAAGGWGAFDLHNPPPLSGTAAKAWKAARGGDSGEIRLDGARVSYANFASSPGGSLVVPDDARMTVISVLRPPGLAATLLAPRYVPVALVLAALLAGLAWWVAGLMQRVADARAELRDRARLQRDLSRYSGLMITVKDRAGRIVEANDTVAAGFARTVPELIGRRLEELLPADTAARLAARDEEVITSGRETSFEETVLMPDGEHTFLAKRFPVRDFEGVIRGVAAVRADITEHVRLEQALRLAKAEAESANLTKSAFLANMSHELRTPLNTIIGLSELVAEELAERGQAHFAEPMQRVVGAGRHLLALINDILDLSRIEAGRVELHPEPCRLHDLIDSVVGVVRPLAEANGNLIEVRFANDPGVLSLDSTRVKQILLNLLSNACKFTRAGDVRVEIGTSHGAHGSRLAIAVADTGIGIEAEQLERIFEPFQQADPSISRRFGGTGLGLSICRQLCNLMGGTLDATSTPGEGSAFTLNLPLVDGPLVHAAETVAHETADGRRGLIVVADDEPDARMLIAGALEREGFEVLAAGSGAETLALVRRAQPALLVLDILLGDMSGWDVLAAVRADQATRHLPVILCTITDADHRAASLGVVEHMTKPFDREHLLALARRFVQPKNEPHVVVADDDAGFRSQIIRRLQTEGWRVREARDGVEAMAALRRQPPDLLLLDLMMPRMDGMAVLAAMREDPRLDRIPVILVSAADLTPEQVRALDRRAVEFVRKCGGDLETMMARMRATLASLDPGGAAETS